MRSFRLITVLGLTALLAGCGPEVSDIGSGGNGNNSGTPEPTATPEGQFITVDATAGDIDLKDTKKIDFVVRGGAGFTGPVTVALSNLPAGVTAAVTSKIVNVTAADMDFADSFDITSDNTVVAPGSYTIHLDAWAGSLTAVKDSPLEVNPFMRMTTLAQKGAGSFAFWDPNGDFQDDGTVVHLGNAEMITFEWVKSWVAPEADHRIHGNLGSGTIDGVSSGSALSLIAGMPCDIDGIFRHSSDCDIDPMASDESGEGNNTVFRRTLRPSNPAAVTVVTFYDHLTGSAGGAADDLPGKITIMP